jgi:type IX secretion system PorP/SprF family membrane protein
MNFTKNMIRQTCSRSSRLLFGGVMLMLVNFNSQSQDYIYGLNQYTPLNFNPAAVAYDNDASVSFLTRKTQISTGLDYKNNVFTGEYPIIDKKSGRRFGGIGFHFADKDAGSSDLLKTSSVGLSLAYNIPIARHQQLSFALQSTYYNKKTSIEKLTTGSQWLAQEFRFDPNASLDESLTSNRINYFGFNSGVLWHLEDPETSQAKAFAGITAFNLNTPDDSFFGNQPAIPVSYLFNAGAIVYHTPGFQLTPQIMYQKDNVQNIFNVLLSGKILFNNKNPYDIIQSGSLELLTKYDLKKDLSFGLVINQPSVSLGFSYNFPLTSDPGDQYFKDGSEFGVRLSKTIWKVEPKKVEIKSTTTAPKRNFNFDNQNNQAAPPVEQKSDTDIIHENIKELSQVKAVQFHLEKDFKFSFGRTELNDEAKLYLDDLAKLLKENPDYKLEVIGHTDNVGKHLVNYRLSEGRAQSVAEYLEQKGVRKDRIKFHGKGDKDPVAPNDTEENRSKNRRVEFLIYINQ